jgi:hypothetical protein
MSSQRIDIELPVRPWYFDHRFEARAIFPAVESLQLLAAVVLRQRPGHSVTTMDNCRFNRFLELPVYAHSLPVIVELQRDENDGIRASLMTPSRHKTMRRLITHCQVLFTAASPQDTGNLPGEAAPEQLVRTVTAEQLYRDLVPFGPAYRTLRGSIHLTAFTASGTLVPPEFTFACDDLGSPFPLDGAMHAACAHGQSIAEFVPFPVGFARRHIHRPTRPGVTYGTTVRLRAQKSDALSYDIDIYGPDSQLCERVVDLQMRDVSNGRIRPPGWLKQGQT